MSGFQLIASLTQSLAWPLAVVVAAFVLRKPLARIVANRPPQRVKAGPFEVEWERLIAETEKEIEGAAEAPRSDPSLPSLVEELRPATEAAPEVAVLEAYRTVEQELCRLIGDDVALNRPLERSGAVRLARIAQEKGLITTDTARAIEGLSVMRNLAAHSSGREITPEKATDFLVLVDAVLYALRQPPRPR
jgi:hypothetical protein